MLKLWMLTVLAAISTPAVARPPVATAEQAARLRTEGAQILFWDQAQRDRNFPAMETIFPGTVVKAKRARRIPAGRSIEPTLGGHDAVSAMMTAGNIAGIVVLKDGKMVLERYARTLKPGGRWTSFSVAKSFTSTLVGAAVKDGFIKSIDDPVTRYLPELIGSAYDGVSIRHILTMTSGVRWNEDYTDAKSDVGRMYAEPVGAGIDATTAYLKRLPREAAPGTKWVYKTGETNLIGVLVTRATGKGLSRYLSEKIWQPYGMERDAFWMTDAGGQEIGGCCMSVALRDYARMGQFMLDGGRDVLPAGWIEAATGPTIATGMRGGFYGYQWWTAPDHYDALGIFGQSVRIDPKRRLVVVIVGAWPTARNREFEARRTALLDAIARAVDR